MIREIRILGDRVALSGEPSDAYLTSLPEDIDDDVLSFLERVVPPDVIAIDVGANLGLHTLALSRLAPEGRIHAFEAHPRTAVHLEQNARANNAHNITVHAVALSGEPGELTLFDNDQFPAGSTAIDRATDIWKYMAKTEGHDPNEQWKKLLRVPATTLDEFAAQHSLAQLDLLKIDVEGYDIDVVRGAKSVLRSLKPVVVMEFASFAITNHRQLLPVHVLDEIRRTFDQVYVVERSGLIREIAGDSDAWDFLWENANTYPVQDLLGAFKGSRLLEPIRAVAAKRQREGLPPPDPSPAEIALAEEMERNAQLTDELDHARAEASHLYAKAVALEIQQETLKRTLSWRVTRPLRAVRRHLPPKKP